MNIKRHRKMNFVMAFAVSTGLALFTLAAFTNAPAVSDSPAMPKNFLLKVQSSTTPLVREGFNSFYPIVNNLYMDLPNDISNYAVEINGQSARVTEVDNHYQIIEPIRVADEVHLTWGSENLSSNIYAQFEGPFNLGNVSFDFASTVLTPDAKKIIRLIAAQIAKTEFKGLYLVGNADRVGTNSANLAISKKRSEVTQKYLTAQLERLGVSGISTETQHMSSFLAKGKSGFRNEADRSVTFLLYPLLQG